MSLVSCEFHSETTFQVEKFTQKILFYFHRLSFPIFFQLRFYYVYTYLADIATPITVIDHVTNWVKHRIFHTKW